MAQEELYEPKDHDRLKFLTLLNIAAIVKMLIADIQHKGET